MKKIMKMLLLAAIFTLALSVSAFAAGEEKGIYDIQYADGFEGVVTLTPQTAGGTDITGVTKTGFNGMYYADAERVKVELTSVNPTKYYLVVAVGTATAPFYPTADNVVYINQDTSSGSTLEFNVYPSAMEDGETYTICISSNEGEGGKYGAYEPVASFKRHHYVPYTLGDVNEDGNINAVDATRVLQHYIKTNILTGNPKLAGDVNLDSNVNAVDATFILQKYVKIIKDFAEIQVK